MATSSPNNLAFGPTRNPYDVNPVPGGSSGGSAAAVAARIAPLAVAEDTFGSIRVPASFCGITGLRPTVGRYPGAGVMPITPRWDTGGAVARTVADLILFDSVLRDDQSVVSPRSLRGARIGIPDYFVTDLHPEVARVTTNAMLKLESAGAVLVRADVPNEMRAGTDLTRTINLYETAGTCPPSLPGTARASASRSWSPRRARTSGLCFETASCPVRPMP
jgi:Asp-tRNA(Asn)/Glu-tRNA(Gln) amidotransferase A subunit family amidase